MPAYYQNKRKIINDPVYGFIGIPDDLIFDVIEHPWFQRLRRIRQLGLTFYVYPAAGHTRFQHALGCTHLMNTALDVIHRKGYDLSAGDRLGALLAILLHDIGHGPFSHVLESSLIEDCSHESVSLLYMKELNRIFDGSLETAIEIFTGEGGARFLHQLVSSQLDMDRMDYLRRDSYFTGVTEGIIGSERIIKMLRVVDDQLVVDRKGIYSIEKFLIARRLMYWQVYLHKTVLIAENMMVGVFKRAKELTHAGEKLFATPALEYFLKKLPGNSGIDDNPSEFLEIFSQLDDNDLMSALKVWQNNEDRVLAILSGGILNRRLLKIDIQKSPFDIRVIENLKEAARKKYSLDFSEADYLVFSGTVSNSAYNEADDQVQLWDNSGKLVELSEASDIINTAMLSKADNKYFLCYPKHLDRDGQ